MKKKIILHLCADIGSDSWPYQQHSDYEVIKVGKDVGVENYKAPKNVYGVIANPPCTEFSTARSYGRAREGEEGIFLVNHCLRIIEESNPVFWVIENPATGSLKNHLGEPKISYQPWEYGSPWTKKTSLWGNFNIPEKLYSSWVDVPKLKLYTRPGRCKPSLANLSKSSIYKIPEFEDFIHLVDDDSGFRSLCSQGFANKFFENNR